MTIAFKAALEDELTKLGFSPYKQLRRFVRKALRVQSPQEKFLEEHFKKPNQASWDKFQQVVQDPKFSREVKLHPASDEKLQRFIGSMNQMHNGNVVATVQGDSGKSYELKRMRGGRLGCTCNDWRFKRSHQNQRKEQDCKHIKKHLEAARAHRSSGVS